MLVQGGHEGVCLSEKLETFISQMRSQDESQLFEGNTAANDEANIQSLLRQHQNYHYFIGSQLSANSPVSPDSIRHAESWMRANSPDAIE